MIPPERLKRYAYFMVKFGTEFNVDPFLLGGLVYQQSRCRERRQNSYGVGLAMINVAMHRPRFDKGHYRYWAHDGGTWKPQRLPKNRFRFTRRSLLRPKANIYFAAKLMSVFQRQCPHMDGLFQSVPHRHPVSHFIWGDRVRGAGVEDRILTDRRRLLEYYHGTRSRALGKFGDLRLACPMDGAPRKLTSGMGDDRERGKRRHTGVDFGSDWGEPVRSVAAGKVILAGVDRGRNQLQSLEPPLTRLVPAARMGPRGLLIKIRHPGGLITEYMHLSAYVVRTGEEVKRGQLLGYVGRSGMKDSMAHLHFGMVFGGKHIDPIPHLRAYVFGPDATYVGRRNADKQRRRRMRRQSVRRAMRAARYLRRWRRARPETQERGEDQGPAAAPARRRRELGPPAQP
jgi:murein DD-endopeptidase MepM/ murein hydrolase activator NlpD